MFCAEGEKPCFCFNFLFFPSGVVFFVNFHCFERAWHMYVTQLEVPMYVS